MQYELSIYIGIKTSTPWVYTFYNNDMDNTYVDIAFFFFLNKKYNFIFARRFLIEIPRSLLRPMF